VECKDSYVFALENDIEKILNHGGWKEPKEIAKALHTSKKTHKIQEKFLAESSEELFVEKVMDRLCDLFPMKYEKDPSQSLYQRAFSNSPSSNDFI